MLGSMIGVLLREGKSVVDHIIDNIVNRGVRASGRTEKSLKYRVEETDEGLTLTVTGPSYIKTLEEGRGPSKGGRGERLYDKIRQWIDDKGIFQGANKDSMAWAITKTIHKYGTNLYRSGGHSGVLSEVINEDRILNLKEELRKVGFNDLKEQLRGEILDVNNNTATK